jgi:hypothetical protein
MQKDRDYPAHVEEHWQEWESEAEAAINEYHQWLIEEAEIEHKDIPEGCYKASQCSAIKIAWLKQIIEDK